MFVQEPRVKERSELGGAEIREMSLVFWRRIAAATTREASSADVRLAAIIAGTDKSQKAIELDLPGHAGGNTAVLYTKDFGAGNTEATNFGQLARQGGSSHSPSVTSSA